MSDLLSKATVAANSEETTDEAAATAKTTPRRRRILTVAGLIALTWLAVVVFSALFADVLAPYAPRANSLFEVLQGPSAAHWLGTDTLGRDILSRLMYGARPTLIGVAIAVIIYVVVGVFFGLIAGYLAGWADRAISAGTAMLIAMPHIIILFVILSIYRGNTLIAMAVLGLMASPVMVLLVRSSALAARNELFVDAAKVAGLSPFYIIFRHILPRVRGLIIVQAAVFGANAIVVDGALSFLGFGEQPPNPTWGNMVAEAASQISLNAWMLYPTGGVMALTALALGVVGDQLRDRVAGGWTNSKLTKSVNHKPGVIAEKATYTGPVLTVQGLEVGYRSGRDIVPIVKGVDFTIPRGATLGMVGESGSGKTTVAFGVLGVVGEGVVVTDGEVRFSGTDLTKLTEQQLSTFRGKRIGYVAQEPMAALDPNLSVGAQLGEAIRLNDEQTPGDKVRERAIELLERVEIRDPAGTLKKYPHELSGGMAQRVSIAFALAGRPELLIADEPTTALDVTVQATILGLLMKLRDESGMSMLIITHDWGVVADVCDRVAVMYKGRIVEEDDVMSIFNDPRHPYTKALLVSNPHGAKPGEDLPVVVGDFPLERVPARNASEVPA